MNYKPFAYKDIDFRYNLSLFSDTVDIYPVTVELNWQVLTGTYRVTPFVNIGLGWIYTLKRNGQEMIHYHAEDDYTFDLHPMAYFERTSDLLDSWIKFSYAQFLFRFGKLKEEIDLTLVEKVLTPEQVFQVRQDVLKNLRNKLS